MDYSYMRYLCPKPDQARAVYSLGVLGRRRHDGGEAAVSAQLCRAETMMGSQPQRDITSHYVFGSPSRVAHDQPGCYQGRSVGRWAPQLDRGRPPPLAC